MGDAGGDDDWYGYCLDDPVNIIDRSGLAASLPLPVPMAPPITPVFIPGTPENKQFVKGTLDGFRGLWGSITGGEDKDHIFNAEHRRNKRKSNKKKHEDGQVRKARDKKGGEKGDARRPY